MFVELDDKVYCSPMRDAVSRAMRMLSDEPLIDGVPDHCATEGILLPIIPFNYSGKRELGRVHVDHTWGF